MPAGTARTAIASEAELLAVAAALEAGAARRYRYLADWWEAEGQGGLTELFTWLAEIEEGHAGLLLARTPGGAPNPAQEAAERAALPDDGAWQSALLTPYRALSLAVREEERAFAFYAGVAAHATAPGLRALAEDLARAELDHAALLRRARRAAYHRERAQPPPPPPADLPALERQRAAWEAEAAAATGRPARLRALSRNAERYMEIAEGTKNEAVLIAAQQLAAQTLRQLALMRAGSDAR
jgi:rubrerythrin